VEEAGMLALCGRKHEVKRKLKLGTGK